MATKHTDPHKLPHCGQCMLNFDDYPEQLKHKEDVAHEVVTTGSCCNKDCKKPNITVKEMRKQVSGELHEIYCTDCLAKFAEKYKIRIEEEKKK